MMLEKEYNVKINPSSMFDIQVSTVWKYNFDIGQVIARNKWTLQAFAKRMVQGRPSIKEMCIRDRCDGLAMGSPLSGLLADIYLNH